MAVDIYPGIYFLGRCVNRIVGTNVLFVGNWYIGGMGIDRCCFIFGTGNCHMVGKKNDEIKNRPFGRFFIVVHGNDKGE